MNNYSRKPNTRPITIALIVSWAIIIVGIRWVFYSGGNDATTTPSVDQVVEQDDAKRWFIGEKVLLKGTIKPVEGFDVYTHTFIKDSGEEFGLKSSTIDLFGYSNGVEIKGEISDFKKSLPIISVTEIVVSSGSNGGDNEDGTDEKPTIENNEDIYYNLKNGLALDLSISDGYSIKEDGDEIALIDSQSEENPVLTIEAFPCKAGDALQDCNVLKDRFISFNNDTFTTANNVTYYNLTETNTWFTFNDNRGYSLRSSSPNLITTFGGLVTFVDEPKLDAYVVSQKEQCKSITSSLASISRIAYQDQGDGVVQAVATGKSSTGKVARCSMLVRLGSSFQSVLVGYDVDGEEVTDVELPDDQIENTKDADEKSIEDNKEAELADDNKEVNSDNGNDEDDKQNSDNRQAITPPSSEVTPPSSFNGWLQYSSVRGFTMWFSKQGVSYVGTVLESPVNVGITGASCQYKINVIQWKQSENVLTSPDVEVYECTGSFTASDAKAAGAQLVGSSGDRLFVAKWYSSNLGEMTIYVEEGANQEDDTVVVE